MDIINEKAELIRLLCKKYGVKAFSVFGSILTSSFNDKSDIDILISFEEMNYEQYTDNYFELHQKLEEMFNRKIDLITEKALKNPYLIESINQNKRIIYAA